jgi:hypothetical protein
MGRKMHNVRKVTAIEVPKKVCKMYNTGKTTTISTTTSMAIENISTTESTHNIGIATVTPVIWILFLTIFVEGYLVY